MQQDPRNQEPEDGGVDPRSEDARKTRLNRIPINDPEATNDRPNDERRDTGYSPGSGSYDATGGSPSEANYGPSQEGGFGTERTGGSMGGATVAPGTMSRQDEQTWSMLSHLSVLLSLITGIGGVVAALVIWLVYKDRSPRVGFHALQSLWYQIAWSAIIIGYSIVSFILTFVVIGIFMFFLLPLIALVPLIHQCYAAYKVSQGEDYRYPFI
ncbi:MAG: DUF4870 domain-containing protein, partial [Rubrobacteraceae bacterium]